MRLSLCARFFLLVVSAAPVRAHASDQIDFFEARIRPVLVAKCYERHSSGAEKIGGEKIGGELLLDTCAALRTGGESGVVIEPGDAEASMLISALRYEGVEMPPSGKLPDHVIADFERWIRQGAVDPRQDHPSQTHCEVRN